MNRCLSRILSLTKPSAECLTISTVLWMSQCPSQIGRKMKIITQDLDSKLKSSTKPHQGSQMAVKEPHPGWAAGLLSVTCCIRWFVLSLALFCWCLWSSLSDGLWFPWRSFQLAMGSWCPSTLCLGYSMPITPEAKTQILLCVAFQRSILH